MDSTSPTRSSADLADVVELLLDKGIVINADIAVSVGDTELLGIRIRAAVASFETAAKYGLEFPEGTDTERLEEATDPERVSSGRGHRPELTGSGPAATPGGGRPSSDAGSEKSDEDESDESESGGSGDESTEVEVEAEGGTDTEGGETEEVTDAED